MKFTPLTQTYSKHCTHCIVFLTDSEWLGISASAKIIEIWICVGFLEPQIVKNSWSTWWGPMSSSGDGGSVNLKSVAGVGLRRRILAKRESPVSNRVNLCDWYKHSYSALGFLALCLQRIFFCDSNAMRKCIASLHNNIQKIVVQDVPEWGLYLVIDGGWIT